jgi:hypothetical protein
VCVCICTEENEGIVINGSLLWIINFHITLEKQVDGDRRVLLFPVCATLLFIYLQTEIILC